MILVVGGAGYIGSHTALALTEAGREVAVLDNLSKGHRAALRGLPLLQGDLLDLDFLRDVFRTHRFSAVVHFAASCYVGESVGDPGSYYRNNVGGTLNLMEAMRDADVKHLVFSSTCATYGKPAKVPITEEEPQIPVNPYGQTKLVCERMMADFRRAHDIRSVSLRYFNAAGADPEGRLGEDHDPETHLIPLVIQRGLGKRDQLCVYGDDYPTPDGTCIRDYVHVNDLASAHVLAVEALENGTEPAAAYNLGNERGTSVLEVIRAVERVAGTHIPYEVGARRPGDPPVLVGSSARIRRELGWSPRYMAIDDIVTTAWRWHEQNPDGYTE